MKKLKLKMNRGMTYVELIVVLSIFSIMSGIVLFNYGAFQAKVDIKNLASDIALKIVEAQKSAMNGTLQPTPFTTAPAYGIYFMTDPDTYKKSFIYFADINNDNFFNDFDYNGNCTGECLSKIDITKGNYISSLWVYERTSSISGDYSLTNLALTFKRPNSGAVMKSTNMDLPSTVSYAEITITSPKGVTATVRVYTSGRIQIN